MLYDEDILWMSRVSFCFYGVYNVERDIEKIEGIEISWELFVIVWGRNMVVWIG